MQKFKSIRGFNDLLPEQTIKFQYIEKIITEILNQSGFKEIRTPIVEYEDLFKRSVGEESDIVSKEMYTIKRNDDKSFTLRPEGTVGVARALIENNLLDTQQKLWYNGYMFRAENPQKGRYRQFQQIGVEVYGISNINIEIELLNLSFKIFSKLGLDRSMVLELNNIGSIEDRKKYSNAIINYIKPFYTAFNDDFIKKFEKNPLRILDSKDEKIKEIIKNIPSIKNYINNESKISFEKLKYSLDLLQIPYVVNEKLIRGLDYYNDLVFEWTTNLSESQGTVCAGGRYNCLVEQLGEKQVPAIGFAIGVERLLLLMSELGIKNENESEKIVICVLDDKNYIYGLNVQSKLINSIENEIIIINEQTSLKSQMKKADKLKSRYVIILGSNEVENNILSVKDMKYGTQKNITLDSFIKSLN